jgi:transposase InsO family protein
VDALLDRLFARRGRAKEAERALEAACIERFGTLRPDGTPILRSDNGSSFRAAGSAACRDYRLRQEFITPYTPEQNGMIERFFRSLCPSTHVPAGSPLSATQRHFCVTASNVNRPFCDFIRGCDAPQGPALLVLRAFASAYNNGRRT